MKELTVTERAKQALAIEHTEKQLQELAAQTADVTAITGAEDYTLVKNGQLKLRDVRVSIEKTGKAARDDANAFAKAVIAEERRLTDIIRPEEDRLKAMRKEVDDAEKRRLAELEAKEQARIDGIQAKLNEIREHQKAGMHETSEGLQSRIDWLNEVPVTPDVFQEFEQEAQDAVMAMLSHVQAVKRERDAYEQEQAELAELRKQQEAEQQKLEAERKALEEEQRKAEAARRAEEDRLRKEREAIERQKFEERARKEAAEQAEREAKERAEREAREKAEREKREAEEKARIEAQRPDLDKLRRFAKELDLILPPQVTDQDCQAIAQTAMKALSNISIAIERDCDALEKKRAA